MFCKNNLEYKTFMKLFCKGQFLLLISGEDRDEPLLPMVGEEIEIEAEESQDQEVRDDYEHNLKMSKMTALFDFQVVWFAINNLQSIKQKPQN